MKYFVLGLAVFLTLVTSIYAEPEELKSTRSGLCGGNNNCTLIETLLGNCCVDLLTGCTCVCLPGLFELTDLLCLDCLLLNGVEVLGVLVDGGLRCVVNSDKRHTTTYGYYWRA